MGQFKCELCGAKAHSKNPATRSVFLHDQDVAMFGTAFTASVEDDKFREGEQDFVLKMSMWKGKDGYETRASTARLFHKRLQNMTEEQFVVLTCKHQWEPVNGPQDYEV